MTENGEFNQSSSTDDLINDNVDNILTATSPDPEIISEFQLDDIARYDFTDCEYAIQPAYKFKQRLWIIPTETEVSLGAINDADEMANEGNDPSGYLWFSNRLYEAVKNGIKRCFEVHSNYGSYNDNGGDGLWYKTGGGWETNWTLRDLAILVVDILSPGLKADLVEAYFYFSTSLTVNPGASVSNEEFFKMIEGSFTYPKKDAASGDEPWAHPQFYHRTFLTSDDQGLRDFDDIKYRSLWQDTTNLIVNTFGLASYISALDEFTFKPEPVEPYSFNPFMPDTFNLGLRLVYRQEWRSLGNQRGDIVKVIPLGPKQVEKVSTKITRRTKITHKAENLKSIETTTETVDTNKDSSEVIEETATTHNWDIRADGSFNVNIFDVVGFGGTVQGPSYGGSRVKKSTDTSTRLNELVQKTANKISTESKINVSRESETSFEETVASEIYNPNEEIAVTYFFSKLLRQYEVFTSLAEVHNVVMIAEDIPSPEEININWVKKHDWILAKVLLDDSFRDALNSISQEIKSSDQSTMTGQMYDVMNTTLEHLGTLTATSRDSQLSLSGIDLVQESQKNFREAALARLERLKENYRLEKKRERLYQHIRTNILHYYRAIWSHEDPQQRILRYRKLGKKVPLNWVYAPGGTGDSDTYYSVIPIDMLTMTTESQLVDVTIDLDGEFVPVHDDKWVYFADLINPAGPIDYIGNYALYYIRPEIASEDILGILHILKAPYLYYAPIEDQNGNVIGYEDPVMMDPLLNQYTQENSQGPIDREIKEEMVLLVPELRMLYEDARRRQKNPIQVGDETAQDDFWKDKEQFIRYYPEFRFRKDRSNLLLLNTNNVVIDIAAGKGTTLEKFKLTHRAIDAMKAYQEKRKLELENERRYRLIQAGELGDPDIERVTIVKSEKAPDASVDVDDE
jgi:hypothetical protein